MPSSPHGSSSGPSPRITSQPFERSRAYYSKRNDANDYGIIGVVYVYTDLPQAISGNLELVAACLITPNLPAACLAAKTLYGSSPAIQIFFSETCCIV